MTSDSTIGIRTLAQHFPGLWKAPGVSPWDAVALDEWAASGGPSHGERCAAQFLLAVWNPDERWRSGKFDVMEALRVFDAQHHRALIEWALNPWWA
jgi:hypothetical protein